MPKTIMMVFGILLLLLCGSHAIGSTPDGETPSNEGICDPLKDATPGLYGMCVAYCEAQDIGDDPDGNKKANRPPSLKILENYNRKKKADDPPMPCIYEWEDCPCWTEEEIYTLSPGFCVDYIAPTTHTTRACYPPEPHPGCADDGEPCNPTIDSCIDTYDPNDPGWATCTNLNHFQCFTVGGTGAGGALVTRFDEGGEYKRMCFAYLPLTDVPYRFSWLTPEEGQACRNNLAVRGSDGGWDCF